MNAWNLLELLILIVLLIITILIWVFPYERVSVRLRKMMEHLPGPKGYPLIGNALSFCIPMEDTLQLFCGWEKQYGPIIRYWIFGTPMVLVADPEFVEPIFNDREITEKGYFMGLTRSWLGSGLLVIEGDPWLRHRRILLPAFHASVLANYVSTFNKYSRLLVDRLRESKVEDLENNISIWALSSLCETSMGIQLDTMDSEGLKYCGNIRRMNELFVLRYRQAWLNNDFLFRLSPLGREWFRLIKEMRKFTGNVIRKRTEEVKKRKVDVCPGDEDLGIKSKNSFIDVLLQQTEADRLNHEELQSEVDTFMFAGHDTTSVTLGWILFALGHHPEEQEKVYQEIQDVLGDNREPTADDLREMTYLEQVICEVQRLYPTISAVIRRLSKDVKAKGYVLPAGCTAVVSLMQIHLNKEYYPEPCKFNPDNFSPEAMRSRHRCSFVPFGYGLRKCIGFRYAYAVMKVAIVHILRNFTLKSLQNSEDLKFVIGIVTFPNEPIKIEFTPRSKVTS